LKIEDLWNSIDLKGTEHSDSLNIKFSILNIHFCRGSRGVNRNFRVFPKDGKHQKIK